MGIHSPLERTFVSKNSKDSDSALVPQIKDSCVKKEITQLKDLNKRLIDNQCRLEEELLMLKQKDTVQNMLLEISPTSPNSKGKDFCFNF